MIDGVYVGAPGKINHHLSFINHDKGQAFDLRIGGLFCVCSVGE
jgi:hypothetical protein